MDGVWKLGMEAALTGQLAAGDAARFATVTVYGIHFTVLFFFFLS
jgi:hypothetical protein